MRKCFSGVLPYGGVTLATVGVYSAVIDTANGLRKVHQTFNPIFAPVVAGMTATGDHEVAAATYARLAQWMLWILLPLVVVLSLAGSTILLIYGPAFGQGGAWLGIVALASAINADGRPSSSGRWPGGTSSATTSPRSVTNTASPDRTSRRYWLKRFFSSRIPTLFIATM